MPHTKSAKKSMRKDAKRRENNRDVKKTLRTQIKKVMEVAKSGTAEQLQEEYNLAAKRLDKAAAKRVVHPNLAARKKSQLAKVLRTKKQAAATA